MFISRCGGCRQEISRTSWLQLWDYVFSGLSYSWSDSLLRSRMENSSIDHKRSNVCTSNHLLVKFYYLKFLQYEAYPSINEFDRIVPESIRWLIIKKRYPEARNLILKAAKTNKKNVPAHLILIPSENISTVLYFKSFLLLLMVNSNWIQYYFNS